MSDDHAGREKSRYREHRPWQDLDTMLSVDDARERILSTISPCEPQPVPLLEAHGLCLAESIVATEPVPPFINSAMDGFAVRAADVASATYDNPVPLRVISEIPAGSVPEVTVGPGEAVRIMTGAAMPDGADTVVRFEETDEFARGGAAAQRDSRDWQVQIRKAPRTGDNVREAGEDIPAGLEVLPAGRRVGAAEMGVLASLDFDQVIVHRRPRIGILATGDEVIEPGEEMRVGQIRNSNNYTLAGLVREAGGEACVLGIARDRTADLRTKLAEVSGFDMMLTSGGVSLGDYDVVKDVLQSEGSIELWQVRIKPGKPMAFGHIGGVPLIGLPGNPVAAYVAFLQFGRPAIRRMLGCTEPERPPRRARLMVEHENRGYRRHFVRGICREIDGRLTVEPVGIQGSGVLTSITTANCLFVIPESRNHAPAGLEVDVIPLNAGD
jgi:molybdopterin molybdotransferase